MSITAFTDLEATSFAGGVKQTVVAVSASGAISVPTASKTYYITKASTPAVLTIIDPTATTHDGVRLTFIATTAVAHTLANTGGSGFNGGGASVIKATFGGAIGDSLTIEAYQGKWYTVELINVTFGTA